MKDYPAYSTYPSGNGEPESTPGEKNFFTLVKSSLTGMVLVDREGVVLYANPAAEKLFGRSIETLIGSSFGFPLISEETTEIQIPRLGALGTAEMQVAEILWGEGKAYLVSLYDITERKRAESAISTSLREKEILLREIHHRVKNNLQIIASLLNLQEGEVDHPTVLEALAVCKGRVMSMAEIHDQLHLSDSLCTVDAGAYFQKFVPRLISAFKADRNISLELDFIPFSLTLDQAIPFGLIVNELVTNSIKHAFKNVEAGTIKVSATIMDEAVVITVEDDGAGLRPGFSLDSVSSLGLQIVSMLAKQLHGILAVEPRKGACFRVQFPLKRD